MKLGLVEVRGGPEKRYTAAEKGRRFLKDFYEVKEHSEIVKAKKRALEDGLAATA